MKSTHDTGASLQGILLHINQYSRGVLPVAISASFTRIIKPYIYIFATARMVMQLQAGVPTSNLWITVGGAVLTQMLLSVLDYWLNNLHQEHRDGLNVYEKNLVTKNLLKMDYHQLEGTELEKKILQHRDELSREGGIFVEYVSIIDGVSSAVIGFVVAVVALSPFLRQLFVKTGPSFAESGWFVPVLLVLTVAVVSVLSLFKGRLEQGNVDLRNQYAQYSFIFSYYREMICNYKTGKEIRIFKQQPLIMKRASDELLEKGVPLQKRITTRNVFSLGAGDLSLTAVLFAFYLAVGTRGASGVYSLSEIVVAIGGCSQLIYGFDALPDVFGRMRRLARRSARYNALVTATAPVAGRSEFRPPLELKRSIEVQNLSFQYDPNGPMILNHINMTITPGEKIAIVGENGSGKTTFIKLLCGLHRPTEGKILLDGQDTSAFDSREYFQLFSVVFQDYHLFALPLGENLAVGEKVDVERAESILKQVNFPQKYDLDTVLYRDCAPEGVDLSGGEAQKAALARAVYKDAPVVILDEPTSALDPYAEFAMYEQFDRLTDGKTAVYISHRLSACRFCDKIAVFQAGELVQFGSHEQLVQNTEGPYYALWNAQAKYFQA